MKLSQYLSMSGKSVRRAAGELGVSPSTVSRWCLGQCLPAPEFMRSIFEWSAGYVTPGDFYDVGGK